MSSQEVLKLQVLQQTPPSGRRLLRSILPNNRFQTESRNQFARASGMSTCTLCGLFFGMIINADHESDKEVLVATADERRGRHCRKAQ